MVELRGVDPTKITEILAAEGSSLIQEHILCIVELAKKNKDKADRSWPVLLKSNTFFTNIGAYLAGIRKPKNGIPIEPPKKAAV